ncbi:MAG: DUF3524 domain-containing protein [Sedimentisphaerales bacterium]|nr:DUF3524 domain-containing protein [Sedimentisphaerales bacterium]
MRILSLEAYYGGSHRAFLNGWVAHSQHQWDLFTLPANKWKWRMRHGAITFVEQVNKVIQSGPDACLWDILFCSDMVNLAEFRGLADSCVARLPTVVYFHENQLTYPVRFESERDYQYALTNFTTALVADAVWFNSGFHRDQFLSALEVFFKRMPDYAPLDQIDDIRVKSAIYPPGIEPFPKRDKRKSGPPRILWAARWEHDKNPDDFFAALQILKSKGLAFRINVIGEQFREIPEVFPWAKDYFTEHIDHWGYQPTQQAYCDVLADADIIVSTAQHEFFGLSIVEAIAAGAYPVLPERLAYPEVLSEMEILEPDEFFYDDTVQGLAGKLEFLLHQTQQGQLWRGKPQRGIAAMQRFEWINTADKMDHALEEMRR